LSSLPFDTTNPTYVDLRERVLQGGANVVPFVGAGLSVYGDKASRLPLWRELIERLITEGQQLGLIDEGGEPEIDGALRAGNYIEAIDRVLDRLGEPTFKRVVERELDVSGKPIPPAVTELVGVAWSLIVSTNLDRLIEMAYLERHGRPLEAFTSVEVSRLALACAGTSNPEATSLAQIHGSINEYRSWRLTQSHYDQLLQDEAYRTALGALFMRQVFFVGFGLQDGDLDVMLRTLHGIYPDGVGACFALLDRRRKGDEHVRNLIRNNGLRPIFYDVDPDPAHDDPFGGHRQVFECLQDLSTAWAEHRPGLEIALKYLPEVDPHLVGRHELIGALRELLETDEGCLVQLVGLGGVGKTSVAQSLLASQGAALAKAGYRAVFGFSFSRSDDVGQFVRDMALTSVGPSALPLPEQVETICDHVASRRTVLFLDGLEVLFDAEGCVSNQYLRRIVEHVVRGRGAVLTTTRVPISDGLFRKATVVEVSALRDDEVDQFLERWGLGDIGVAARRKLGAATAGHPLALHVICGVLRNVPAAEAAQTIERTPILQIGDDIDPLRENRLARVLGSYLTHLSDAQQALLMSATVFAEPVPYPLLTGAVSRSYRDTEVNAPLIGRDLRVIVNELIDRRLLSVGPTGDLATHPTVHEYFARRARDTSLSLAPLHQHLTGEYLRGSVEQPETFDEATPLLAVCRHAAACENWTLFEETFVRLMRGQDAYLCDQLGAWDEALSTARLALDGSYPVDESPEPAYFPLIVARSLKHLGRSHESRVAYLDGLERVAASRDPYAALYVNNFLTLLAWRGELDAASALAPINLKALSWINDDWTLRWQTQHELSSIAYVKLLRGELAAAEQLFAASDRAWDGFVDGRQWTWDYYPFYRSELFLLRDPEAYDEAQDSIDQLLSVAERLAWPEPMCRGYVQAAALHLDRAERTGESRELELAFHRLGLAAENPAAMVSPDIEISLRLLQIRAAVVQAELSHQLPDVEAMRLDLAAAQAALQRSGLDLAAPEVLAAEGVLAQLESDPETAHARFEQAVRVCHAQSNRLYPMSSRAMTGWLGKRLGTASAAVACESPDLLVVVGDGLDPQELLTSLQALR
jgi:hypothetical protein